MLLKQLTQLVPNVAGASTAAAAICARCWCSGRPMHLLPLTQLLPLMLPPPLARLLSLMQLMSDAAAATHAADVVGATGV